MGSAESSQNLTFLPAEEGDRRFIRVSPSQLWRIITQKSLVTLNNLN
jgi:hypothetical protein